MPFECNLTFIILPNESRGETMDSQALRALYDQQQRLDVQYPGTRREVTEQVVRVIEPVL